MTKSKNRPTKWQFFHENHQLDKVIEMKRTDGFFVLVGFYKVIEMKRTDGFFVLVGFSRTKTERLKNWSGKCEGPGWGIDGLKNRSGKCEGSGGGDRWVKEPEWEM